MTVLTWSFFYDRMSFFTNNKIFKTDEEQVVTQFLYGKIGDLGKLVLEFIPDDFFYTPCGRCEKWTYYGHMEMYQEMSQGRYACYDCSPLGEHCQCCDFLTFEMDEDKEMCQECIDAGFYDDTDDGDY